MSGPDARGQQCQMQGASARVDANAVWNTAVRSKFLFKRSRLFTQNKLAALEHARDCSVDFSLQFAVLSSKIEKRNHES